MAHSLVGDEEESIYKRRVTIPKGSRSIGPKKPKQRRIGAYPYGYAPVYRTTPVYTAAAPVSHGHRWAFCDWFLILLLIGFLVWILVLVTVNYNNGGYIYVSSKNGAEEPNAGSFLDGGTRQDPMKCKPGEQWDKDTRMCAPIMYWPVAVDNSMMDMSVTACDDFYRHACGKWIDNHEDENYAFSYVHKKNQFQVHKLIRDPTSGPVHTFYQSCVKALVQKQPHALEETKIEKNHMLEKILGDIRHVPDLPVAFGRLGRAGYTSPITVSIEQHPRKPIMVPLVHWDGFEPNTISHERVTAIFVEAHGFLPVHAEQFATRVLKVLNGLSAHRPGEGVNGIHSYVEYVKSDQFQRDMITFGELPSWSGYNDHASGWNTYLERIDGHGLRFEHDHPTWLLDAHYIQWLLHDGLTEYTMDEWRAFLTFCILHNTHDYAPDLPQDVYFRKHIYLAHTHPEKRHPHRLRRRTAKVSEESCVRITQYMIPGLVAAEFLHRELPEAENTREKLTNIVNQMKDTFADMIENTHWMDEQTKSVTAEKIRAIIPRVAHPNIWSVEPFSSRLNEDRWLHNMNMVRGYRVERNMANWHEQGIYNRDAVAVFGAPASTVNAFYSPLSNSISIFAGILKPPFYMPKYAEVSVWARMSSILGHELSHSIDNHGRHFTKDGIIPEHSWWTQHSLDGFEYIAKRVIREYGAPQDCPNQHYGEYTLGEDIADLSGVTMSYLSVFPGGKGNRTEQQWFFQSFAQMWAAAYSQERRCKLVNEDEHALPSYRVKKTLKHMDGFHKAFGCGPGTGMFVERENRIVMYGD